jgi:LPXTG-motif cell wall-anchored protein
VRVSAPQQRGIGRRLAGLASVAVVAVFGLTLMGSPASATEGDSGRIDTSATTVETQSSALTRGGNDNDCTGDKCKRVNWCKGYEKPGDKPPAIESDAPAVRFGNDGDKGSNTPKCIKKPVLNYKCCVPDREGTADVVVTVTNPNHHGGYKVRVEIGEQVKEEWIEAGKTVKLTFTGLGNGKYEVKGSVWTGKGGVWCAFKPCPIVVKCAKPIPTSPSPSVSTSTSTPPTSTSPSTSPSATTSTSPVPGGGGGDNEQPSLPVTGSSTGWVAGGAAVLLVAGVGLFFLARRRRVNFTA